MKKTVLTSIAMLGAMACLAQNPAGSVDQQRRGTIISNPRQAGTAVLVFTERPAQRDYTQPVVLSSLPTGLPANPAFILMRSTHNAGNFANNFSTNFGLNQFNANPSPSTGFGNGFSISLPSAGGVTLPAITIPGLPGSLPSLPQIINPVVVPIITPVVKPIITPILPVIKPVLPIIK